MVRFGKGGLEALEQRVGIGVFGDVGKEFVGERGDRAGLDFGRRQLRTDQIGGRRLGEGEDASLNRRAPQFAVDVGQSILIMAADVGIRPRTDQVVRCRSDLPPKSL